MLFFCFLFSFTLAKNTTLVDWVQFNNYSEVGKAQTFRNRTYSSRSGTPNGISTIKGIILSVDGNSYAYTNSDVCPLFHFEPPFANQNKSTYKQLVLSMTQRCINVVDTKKAERNDKTGLKLDVMNLQSVKDNLKNENISLYTCLVNEIYTTKNYPGPRVCCCRENAVKTTLSHWYHYKNYSRWVQTVFHGNHYFRARYGTPIDGNNNSINTSKGLILLADGIEFAHTTTDFCPFFHFELPYVNENETTNETLVLSMEQRCMNLVNNSVLERNKSTSLKLDFMNYNQVEAQLQNDNSSLYTCLVSDIRLEEGYPGPKFCCCPTMPVFEIDDHATVVIIIIPSLLFLLFILGLIIYFNQNGCENCKACQLKYKFESI